MMKDYPSKLYYSISEVASITEVKAHVLRYWETEFPTLRPKKTRSGSRRYRQTDIEEIMSIKNLLYVEGFKIAGARKMRKQTRSQASKPPTQTPPQMDMGFDAMDDRSKLAFIKEELNSLLQMVREMQVEPAKGSAKPQLKEMKEEG